MSRCLVNSLLLCVISLTFHYIVGATNSNTRCFLYDWCFLYVKARTVVSETRKWQTVSKMSLYVTWRDVRGKSLVYVFAFASMKTVTVGICVSDHFIFTRWIAGKISQDSLVHEFILESYLDATMLDVMSFYRK